MQLASCYKSLAHLRLKRRGRFRRELQAAEDGGEGGGGGEEGDSEEHRTCAGAEAAERAAQITNGNI
jgi:hypothetical protein